MTLVMNNTIEKDTTLEEAHHRNDSSNHRDELIIRQESKFHHLSAMPADLRKRKQEGASEMAELFHQTMQEKGEYDPSNVSWTDHKTVEVEGLSKMAVHNFILKAEALGKDITYTKQTIISIS
ncbi:MAG: hypothetical protein ABJG78_09100 [Cyclobacteriaceae bacterium]